MDVQNLVGLSGFGKPQTVTPTQPGATSVQGNNALPQSGPAAAGTVTKAAAPTVPPSTLAQAADTLQKQVSQQAPSVALSAGLDPSGDHPGQLLVELKDKTTQQVFVRYFVPSEQVVKAATQSPDQPMPPGSLLQEKA
ncbi:hypothetical protein [Thiomonas intermedia]|uniref:hypothetical protein n=1 Tax=Thiomonas intermedia TaxID=926 RepID=UPI0009A536FD|nr:hypothetical protein [Thiomonas intermedia]